jgi:hypothetical protein
VQTGYRLKLKEVVFQGASLIFQWLAGNLQNPSTVLLRAVSLLPLYDKYGSKLIFKTITCQKYIFSAMCYKLWMLSQTKKPNSYWAYSIKL